MFRWCNSIKKLSEREQEEKIIKNKVAEFSLEMESIGEIESIKKDVNELSEKTKKLENENKYKISKKTDVLLFRVPIILLVVASCMFVVKFNLDEGLQDIIKNTPGLQDIIDKKISPQDITNNNLKESYEKVLNTERQLWKIEIFIRAVKYLFMPVLITYILVRLDAGGLKWRVLFACIYLILFCGIAIVPGEPFEFLLESVMSPLVIALLFYLIKK